MYMQSRWICTYKLWYSYLIKWVTFYFGLAAPILRNPLIKQNVIWIIALCHCVHTWFNWQWTDWLRVTHRSDSTCATWSACSHKPGTSSSCTQTCANGPFELVLHWDANPLFCNIHYAKPLRRIIAFILTHYQGIKWLLSMQQWSWTVVQPAKSGAHAEAWAWLVHHQ